MYCGREKINLVYYPYNTPAFGFGSPGLQNNHTSLALACFFYYLNPTNLLCMYVYHVYIHLRFFSPQSP